MKKLLVIILAVITFSCFLPAMLSAEQAPTKGAKLAELSDQNPAASVNSSIRKEDQVDLGRVLPLWAVLPFVGILLSIALFPLLAPHFWHSHFPKVSAFWALAFAVPFVIAYRGEAFHEILKTFIIDYIPFIILLWGLFTVSAGIYVRGTLKGSPAVNTLLLLIGTLLASWVGTTGASMLMIRPVIRSNSWRKHNVHTIVFFIFLISNIGGALTPLGDPPLFLGFLHGVPFFWTFKLIPHMGFAVIILLAAYFIFDTFYYKKEDLSKISTEKAEPIKIEGGHNFLFLGGIVGAVLFSGLVPLGGVNILGIEQKIEFLVKDAVIILMGVLSYFTTKNAIREENQFSWAPILEVAYLFAGIFMTIIPALAILQAGEHGALAFLIKSAEKPAHYFWASGSLSSFLDNAPTYLTFFNSALGKFYAGMPEAQSVPLLIKDQIPFLAAISAGSVFMGANSYIGNAPNFMVKSIAEEAGVKMPSFFGYIFKYSLPILVVLFIIMTFIFF